MHESMPDCFQSKINAQSVLLKMTVSECEEKQIKGAQTAQNNQNLGRIVVNFDWLATKGTVWPVKLLACKLCLKQ